MEAFSGARWLRAPDGTDLLLLSVQPVSGGRWRYVYSIAPAIAVAIVTEPGPHMPEPGDTLALAFAADLARRSRP